MPDTVAQLIEDSYYARHLRHEKNRLELNKTATYAALYGASNRRLSTLSENTLMKTTHSYVDHEAMESVEGLYPVYVQLSYGRYA